MKEDYIYRDRELFKRIAQGEEAAFTEIYLSYVEDLYTHVAKLVDSEAWAEEIVQEVFMKIWQMRDKLRSVENPSAYIFRMAGNRTMDYLKHRVVEAKAQYRLIRFAESSKNYTQEQLDFRASEKLFKEAVNQLTAQKQLIFKLKHEEGLSYDEIALKLNLSKNTVRNHLAEALQTLRTYLLKHGIFMIICLYDWASH